MGWFTSDDSSEKVDNRDNSVTSNVHINDRVDVTSNEILILLAIICGIKIFELLSFIYRKHYRDVKKRFTQSI